MTVFNLEDLTCPIMVDDKERILLAHGSGGSHMHKLLEEIILPQLMPKKLGDNHDAAVLTIGQSKIAFTTDSFVVSPLFFPGGDIGSLSVHGTINDLAMVGAKPLYISVAFILEEGFQVSTLKKILSSIHQAASTVNVEVVTGDTKVVERGKGHGIYINTAGIGLIQHNQIIRPQQIQNGDAIIVSGDIGRHGIAIMALREGLEFATTIESDSAPVADIVTKLLTANIPIHCLRDVTRGGLATTLNELALATNMHFKLEEKAIPVQEEVGNACELLGLDILQVACEGRFVALVPEAYASQALQILHNCHNSVNAAIIGVTSQDNSFSGVTMKNLLGITRIIDKLTGEQLPRIC